MKFSARLALALGLLGLVTNLHPSKAETDNNALVWLAPFENRVTEIFGFQANAPKDLILPGTLICFHAGELRHDLSEFGTWLTQLVQQNPALKSDSKTIQDALALTIMEKVTETDKADFNAEQKKVDCPSSQVKSHFVSWLEYSCTQLTDPCLSKQIQAVSDGIKSKLCEIADDLVTEYTSGRDQTFTLKYCPKVQN